MSKGCVIFADKTDLFDYGRLASMAAERVERRLNIPVTILTADNAADNTLEAFTESNNSFKQIHI